MNETESEVGFSIIKTIIMNQNEELLTNLANDFNLDIKILKGTYLKPEYYLPILVNTKKIKAKKRVE